MDDLNWDYIINACEMHITGLENIINTETERSVETQRSYLRCARALLVAVPKLRAHPELEKIPPWMSLLSLRWFTPNKPEVDVYYNPQKAKYEVTILRWQDLKQFYKTMVNLDGLTDTVWKFITRVKNSEF